MSEGEQSGGSGEGDRLTLLQRGLLAGLRRQVGRKRGEPLCEEDWAAVLDAHASRSGRAFQKLWLALPGSPRCGMCSAPFSGPGRLVSRPLGYKPSRKNPTLCASCVEASPPGGATLTTGILFADLRGFTSRDEGATPSETSALLSRFYGLAESVLFPEAIIDKLIGDEVMALYMPQIEPHIEGSVPALMVDHARGLLEATGYGSGTPAEFALGIGIDYGEAFVGNVGEHVHDFTAVGDVVNTASRLQGLAGPGEIVISERVAAGVPDCPGERERVELKGKAEPEPVRRIRL